MTTIFNKHIVIIYLLVLVASHAYSQKKNAKVADLFDNAMELAEQENYNGAIENFKRILERNPKNLDALFNMGLCYLNTSNSADTAVVCFTDGLTLLTPEELGGYIGNEFRYSLAEAYQVMLDPNKALVLYNDIIENTDEPDSTLLFNISRKIEVCKNAAFFIQNPIEIEVENLGTNVNSMYDDHSPLVTVSEQDLFFTSRRKWIKVPLLSDGQYAEKIYTVSIDKNNLDAAKVLKIFFKNNEHESAASLSPDGNTIVLFRNDDLGKSLYKSRLINNEWSEPERFPEPINSDYEETHGSISADMSTLYFTSDRPGGYGGLDIYLSRLDENNKWQEPINLGPEINSPYDEETPQIHYDGKTLYFSSEGHNTMGHLDVFYSEMRSDSTWNTPVNMGYPINTPDDDFFFTPTINKSHAYYASSRFANNYGGADVYRVKFKENSSSELAVVEGVVDESLGTDFSKMRVLVTRTKDNVLVGNYRPSSEDGKYLLFLEVGYEYEVSEKNKVAESVAYINADKQTSYAKTKQTIAFENIAMSAPLKQTDLLGAEDIIAINEVIKDIETPDSIHIAEVAVIIEATKINDTVAAKPERKVSGYTIQIYALKKGPLANLNLFRKKGIKNIDVYKCSDGFTRYTFGTFNTYSETLRAKQELIKKGLFSDLWIRPNRDLYALQKD